MKLLRFFILIAFLLNITRTSHAFFQDDVPINIDSRIKTLIYSENEIYNLRFRVGYQSIIEIGLDETIELISLGDPYPWKITPIDRRIFIKPLEPGVVTNMTVITDRRVYLLEISSDMAEGVAENDIIYVARFFYPDFSVDKERYTFEQFKLDLRSITKNENNIQQDVQISSSQSNKDDKKNDPLPQSIPNSAVNLSYSIDKNTGSLAPLEVFDDGKTTYLRLTNNAIAFKVYAYDKSQNQYEIKYKISGPYISFSGIYNKLTLVYQNEENNIYNDSTT